MAKVYVSIGSNIDRERHITAALDALAEKFSVLDISSVYESEAVGFAGDNFFNLVAGFDTDKPVSSLSACLREIDILTYDHCAGEVGGIVLPRAEILENAFVLLPLAEIAPDDEHPVERRSFSGLWQAYSKQQKLWPVDFVWRGKQISKKQCV